MPDVSDVAPGSAPVVGNVAPVPAPGGRSAAAGPPRAADPVLAPSPDGLVHSDVDVVVEPDDTGARRRRRRKRARRHIGRSVKLVLFLFIVNNVVIPQIGGARHAAEALGDVNPAMLALGLVLQLASLASYALLTRAALPAPQPHVHELVRMQLATKAVTNTVPGGNAAGSALGYKLLTATDVRGADAGFALATAGIGSAVVLNLILWVGLLISIPLRGFNQLYVTAALIGVLLMGGFAFVVFGLVKGSAVAERIMRAIARKLRFIDEDKAGEVVRRLATRLGDLLSDPPLLRRAGLWATAQTLLDAASLWVFLRAFQVNADIDALIVSYGLANVLAAIPITPGGLGIVEATLITTLTGFGLGRGGVALGVTSYRLASFWLPIPLGALSYVSLRIGPWSLARRRRLRSFRTVHKEAMVTGGDRLTWAERYGRGPTRRYRPPP